MATVWLATDLRHERPVAIKVLHRELAGAIGVDRFLREVKVTARLQHPNIIPVLDSGVVPSDDGIPLPWYAMGYIAGESLRARLLREQQLPVEEALHITAEVASALEAAHQEGIIHRDIKPDNVLLAGGRAYVLDFGIAKALIETGGDRLTSTGLAIGTPAYMSPEQSSAGVVDARSDQYSVATLLYEMLAGEPPFAGPTAQAIVARRLSEAARPLRSVRSTVPIAVEQAVLKALERVPADRFAGVAAFVAALGAPPSPGIPPRVRRPGLGVVLAGALLAGVILGGWLLSRSGLGAGAAPRDPAVVALYSRGTLEYQKRTPAGLAEAIQAFTAAVRRDSTYAAAWTGLAKCYARANERRFLFPGEASDSVVRLAVQAVDRALALDRRNADTWVTQAIVSRQVNPTDLAPTLRSIRQALALDSSNAEAWHFLALSLAESGDLEAALPAWRRSVTVDPSYTQGVGFLSHAHYWRREYDSAAFWADSAIALDPNYLLGWTEAGNVAVAQGNFARGAAAFDAARRLSTDIEVPNTLAGSALAEARAGVPREARTILQRAEALAASYTPAPLHTAVYMAEAYAALAERDRAIAWLRRFSPAANLHFQLHLRCDPTFDPIR
ncbi:MAG: protein kinase domain-containing protein, partial [Gemmatimonadales bacterium]